MRISARMIFYKYLVLFALLVMYSIFIVGGGAWQSALLLTGLYGIIFAPILLLENVEEIQNEKT